MRHKTHKIAPRWIMCLFQLLEVQKHHQSTQTHINNQFWHPTWPCLIVNNTPISFLWIYMWPIFLTTQPYVKCSKIAKISKFKLQLLKKIIVKHLNPFKFSHCQQIPPLFFRRDSLTSYHLCNTRPMANVRLKDTVHWQTTKLIDRKTSGWKLPIETDN